MRIELLKQLNALNTCHTQIKKTKKRPKQWGVMRRMSVLKQYIRLVSIYLLRQLRFIHMSCQQQVTLAGHLSQKHLSLKNAHATFFFNLIMLCVVNICACVMINGHRHVTMAHGPAATCANQTRIMRY
jgi:hypothetical protein